MIGRETNRNLIQMYWATIPYYYSSAGGYEVDYRI